MEIWVLIASFLFGTTGMGGFVISVLESRSKMKQTEKLNNANIEKAKADMQLQLEQARALIVNDLQEERTAAIKRAQDLEEDLAILRSRVAMLEGILRAHNINIPN